MYHATRWRVSSSGRTHSSLNSIEVGRHSDVHGASPSTTGEELVILEREKGISIL